MTARALMLHAITRRGDDLDGLRGCLGFPSAAPDLLGHGAAPRASRYTLADYAAAIDLPASGRFALYGHSLGGLVALVLAARHPGRVTALILEDPPLYVIEPERFAASGTADAFAALATRVEEADLSSLTADVTRWPSGKDGKTLADALGPEGLARRAAALYQTDPATLRAPGRPDFLGDLAPDRLIPDITCPIHLLAGHPARGSVLSAQDRARFAHQAQKGAVRMFGRLGHDIHSFAAAECAELISRYAAA